MLRVSGIVSYRKLPPLHALAAFEAAARNRSFAKAGDELALTHSAISHRIRQLEEHLGTKLFTRLHRNVVLTPAGAFFLVTVRQVLDELQAAAASVSATPSARLKLSVAPGIATNWLVHRLAGFHEAYPAVDLEIESTSTVIDLRNSDVDVGIRYAEPQLPGLFVQTLFRERLAVVCSAAYLERAGPFVRPRDLQRATFLRSPQIPWRPWFEAAGLPWPEPRNGPIYRDMSMLLQAAIGGSGLALAGCVLSAAARRDGELVQLFELTIPAAKPYVLACDPRKRMRAEVRQFIEWIAEVAAAEPAGSTDAQPFANTVSARAITRSPQ